MDTNLQSNVLDRLQSEEGLPDKVPVLVLAALLGEIEECLGGKTPSEPSSEPTETEAPVRASTILSAQMMVEHLGFAEAGTLIERAVVSCIEGKETPKEIGGELGTREVGDAVCRRMKEMA